MTNGITSVNSVKRMKNKENLASRVLKRLRIALGSGAAAIHPLKNAAKNFPFPRIKSTMLMRISLQEIFPKHCAFYIEIKNEPASHRNSRFFLNSLHLIRFLMLLTGIASAINL